MVLSRVLAGLLKRGKDIGALLELDDVAEGNPGHIQRWSATIT